MFRGSKILDNLYGIVVNSYYLRITLFITPPYSLGIPLSEVSQPLISENVKRYTLGVLVVVYTFNFIDRQILSILIEPIKADLGISDFGMGLLSGTAFAIFYATLGMPLALVADRWNRRNLIGLSLAVWSGMTALSGFAMNFWQLAAGSRAHWCGHRGSRM